MKSKRPSCPFYGFFSILGVQEESKNKDDCTLIYRPCPKSIKGKIPNWEICPNNTKEFQEELKSLYRKIVVYSNELSGKGILLEDWVNYVMKPKKAS